MAKRRSAEGWRELVEEWLVSGMSKESFARSRGVSPGTLGWWRWRLGIKRSPEPAFLDVVVAEPVAAPDLVVEIGALRVRVPVGFDAGELRRLVDALC